MPISADAENDSGGICIKDRRNGAGTLIGVDEKVAENGDITAEREIKTNLIAEPLVLEFGAGLIPFIMALQNADSRMKIKCFAFKHLLPH
ncbi:MAG: hypothetical protein NC489_40565 [Ruminococcus flavefaciens]|nr:hypothetical protein [Ruminococcus flavefaciens]